MQKVRDAERERMYDEYINRIGEIVNGTVKRVEYGNVIVDLGRGEAIIRRDELIPREMYRYGDRVRAYIYDVRREQRGPQIFLSRTHPQFMAKLFMQEVPEIYDGIITIRSIARDPGSRAKIAVTSSTTSSIDPVGACVGMRGSRVQAVVGELQGEKIDIIPWTDNIADLVVSALQPADVAKVVLDEQAERIEVVVPDEQLSLAIGRRGQNVRLASQLIGWDIDILTEQEESERRQKEFTERSALFMQALDVDEMVAQLLASEGFSSVEELAYIDAQRNRLDPGLRRRDRRRNPAPRHRLPGGHRARPMTKSARRSASRTSSTKSRASTPPCWWRWARKTSRRVEDFAGCAADDLVGWTERKDGEAKRFDGTFKDFPVSREEAEDMILQARLKAGWITEDDLAARPTRTQPRKERPRNAGDSRPGGPARRNDDGMCALTREVKPVAELIRFVARTRRRAGARYRCQGRRPRRLDQPQPRAGGRGGQEEGLRAEPQDRGQGARRSAGLTRLRLEQRFLSALGMARKAGQIADRRDQGAGG